MQWAGGAQSHQGFEGIVKVLHGKADVGVAHRGLILFGPLPFQIHLASPAAQVTFSPAMHSSESHALDNKAQVWYADPTMQVTSAEIIFCWQMRKMPRFSVSQEGQRLTLIFMGEA